MNISENKLDNAKVELKIEVPEDRVNLEYENVFNELRKKAKVDGFRPGKAPMELVKKKYKGNADRDTIENLLKSCYVEAIQEKGFSPINTPEFDFENIEIGKPFKFTAVFEVFPTIELGNYKGLNVEEKEYKIADEDIDKEVEILRERNAAVSQKPEGEAAEKGDYVRLDIKRIDNIDKNEIDNIKFDEVPLILGKEGNDYGFDDDVIGMKTGDEKEVTVKYPKDHKSKVLAGQKVTYIIKPIAVNKLTLPDIDDEFAKDIGDYSSVEELRKKIRENLENFVKETASSRAKDDLMQSIIEKCKFDMPESMVRNEMENVLSRVQQRIGLPNVDMKELLSKSDVKSDEFFGKIREEAVKNIKSTLVLMEIAKAEQLKVSDDKYREVLGNIAKSSNKAVEEIEEQIKKNNSRENIETELILGEASDFIYKSASIKKLKSASFEKFMEK